MIRSKLTMLVGALGVAGLAALCAIPAPAAFTLVMAALLGLMLLALEIAYDINNP